jgi:hypothetical protein
MAVTATLPPLRQAQPMPIASASSASPRLVRQCAEAGEHRGQHADPGHRDAAVGRGGR